MAATSNAQSKPLGRVQPKKVRDPRLDFFRGVAMLIIFIAHTPANLWNSFIPARFGWSDATEMFVFCSGFAAAIAFGGTFIKSSFWYGTARIGYRIWQIYAAHIGMFAFIATIVVAGNVLWVDAPRNYVDQLNLGWFFNNPKEGLLGLFTLTYVPNYFDILPMYIGALIMIPILMALAVWNKWAAMAFSVAVYLGVWIFDWKMPAEWHSDREWFFNPFAWQLLFFTGFAFSMGWINAPKPNRWLVGFAAAFVLFTIPGAHWPTAQNFELFREYRNLVWDIRVKTDFGILRYIHFLCLAYLAIVIVKGREHYLLQDWAKPIITVGQNSLAVFLLSMGLGRIAGMALDALGRNGFTFALVNLGGMAILIGFAYWCTMLKRQPWKQLAVDRAEAAKRRQREARDRGASYLDIAPDADTTAGNRSAPSRPAIIPNGAQPAE